MKYKFPNLLCWLWLSFICSALFLHGTSVHAQGYPLGVGDQISVTVLRHPEMSAEQITVSPTGRINLPVAGEVVAAGKTLSQLDNEITRRLRVRLLRPEVTVTLRQARPRQVFVLGAVSKAGTYELRPGWRVSEALTLAGGLTAKPELTAVTLSRANRKAVSLNLLAILNNSNSAENRILQPGDTLRFSERTMQISVTGSVQRGGPYEVPIGSRVLSALALAGGASANAALSKTVIRRIDGSNIAIDLHKATVLGDKTQDVALRPGDVIDIPESIARVTVLGAVVKPGFVDIRDGDIVRVAESVALAGGAGSRAALTRAVVQRADGSTTATDLYKILVQGDQTGNIPLAPGDVVVIPESRGITVLGAVLKPGTFNVEEGSQPRVSDLLALAGGLSIPPETARITIARSAVASARDSNAAVTSTSSIATTSASTTSSVDAVSLLELRDLNQNERVQDGDLITVSAQKSQTVFVSGEVKTPGAFEIKEGDGLSELIARAGGATPLAALKKVSVVERDGTVQVVDIVAATRDGAQKLNFPLKEGDYVVVPKNEALVLVMPAVQQPGYYPVPEDKPLTVGEAIALAGGPKDRAKLKEVAVLRQTPTGVQRRVLSLDKTYNGQLGVNTTLLAGDVVYVPEGRTTPSAFENITRALSVLGTLRLGF
jgi:protein involved in polysaccharide export with SLBB domain